MSGNTITEIQAAERTRVATEPSAPLSASRHFKAIDGLRGIAVLLVMLHHFYRPVANAGGVVSQLVRKPGGVGWCGVDLFFVLSGFLITGILLDSKHTERYFRTFYIRRTLRIFPLYYGVLAAFFLVVPLFWKYGPGEALVAAHQQSLWLYYANFEIASQGWILHGGNLNMGHFWSLAVEEQFYLIWPALVLICSRRGLMGVCIGMIALSLGLRLWFVYGQGDLNSAYLLTPCRMDCLAWGALAAAAGRGRGGIAALGTPARILLGVGGAGLVLTVALAGNFARETPLVATLGFSALGAFFAAALVCAIAARDGSLWQTVCSNVALRATGRIAYGLYVFHVLLLPMVEESWPVVQSRLPSAVAPLVYLLGAFGSVYLVSALSWHLFEKRFLRLKERWAPAVAA
jgi:peptidoglycan/LPS O-acetylase OafA/YrhL